VPAGRQDPAHPGFVAADRPYDCAQCVRWHAAHFDFPELAPGNQLAWELFWLVQDQQRAAAFDLLGLDYGVLPWLFRVYRIPRRAWRPLFERFVVLNREVTRHRAQRAQEERAVAQARQMEARGQTRLDVGP
jgi:hypothetical protein